MSICVENDKMICGSLSRTARIIAIDEQTGKLAVIRKSRTQGIHDYVEFFNVLTGWLAVPELVICPENGSIEHAIFVANGDLMTSHSNGSICFIDPHNNQKIKRVQIGATTIWAACDHPQKDAEPKSRIALVTHSSVLYFFDTINKMIMSSISLGVDSRLFDVASNGELVAIGSIDGIMIAGDGKVQKTLKLDRENRRDPTIAWSVLFIKPDVLACGDSRGNLTIWNPNTSALLQSINCLQSHILTMCMVDGKLNVAGIDPRITEVKEMTTGDYTIVNRRNGPSRDVRKLVAYDDRVYASGEDFEIFVGKEGCRELLFQNQKNIKIQGNIIGSASENYIDIWWKEEGEDEPIVGSDVLQQHHRSVYLAKVFAPNKHIMSCWTLSDDSTMLAIGTQHDVSIYHINPSAKKNKDKIVKLGTIEVAATALLFDKQNLIISKSDFEILSYDLAKMELGPKTIMKQTECGSVVKMCISPDSQLITVLTTRSQVFMIHVEQSEARLAKVPLPIDILCNSHTAYVLATQPAFLENGDSKKILYEVGVTNGLVKRAATSMQLKMVPTSPKSVVPGLPVALVALDEHRFMVTSYDGHWSIIDTQTSSIINTFDGQLKAKKAKDEKTNAVAKMVVGVRRREEKGDEENVMKTPRLRRTSSKSEDVEPINSRIVVLRLEGDVQPKTDGFKLRKFGMQ